MCNHIAMKYDVIELSHIFSRFASDLEHSTTFLHYVYGVKGKITFGRGAKKRGSHLKQQIKPKRSISEKYKRYKSYFEWYMLRPNFTWYLSLILGLEFVRMWRKTGLRMILLLDTRPQSIRIRVSRWSSSIDLAQSIESAISIFCSILVGRKMFSVLSDDDVGSILACDIYFHWPYDVWTVRYYTVRYG